ncbi:hypothetical protein M0805_004728 [Coniferiporia weirii]|nr:hypothetical protein M0805_004728 [Coniferiporia weirii]
MAQGKSKGLQVKAESSRHAAKAAANMKKGRRAIAPKRAAAVKQAALHKTLSAKINRSIEQQAASAVSPGALTIMRPEAPAEYARTLSPFGISAQLIGSCYVQQGFETFDRQKVEELTARNTRRVVGPLAQVHLC